MFSLLADSPEDFRAAFPQFAFHNVVRENDTIVKLACPGCDTSRISLRKRRDGRWEGFHYDLIHLKM